MCISACRNSLTGVITKPRLSLARAWKFFTTTLVRLFRGRHQSSVANYKVVISKESSVANKCDRGS